jgi:hypothetical protein
MYKENHFLYVFSTQEILVYLVNLEEYHSPLHSWLSPAGTVSQMAVKHPESALEKGHESLAHYANGRCAPEFGDMHPDPWRYGGSQCQEGLDLQIE